MLAGDLPDNFDYQSLIDDYEAARDILLRLVYECQKDDKGQWITIRQLTGDDLTEIWDFLEETA